MIFAGVCGDEAVELGNAISVEINQELGVPADSMTVSFAYDGDFPSIERIYALESDCIDIDKSIQNGDVLFSGIVDEIILIADTSSATVKVYSRSLAALLIDNECKPTEYVNPSIEVIYNKHLLPFGITLDSKSVSKKRGTLTLHKGASHFKALESFCKAFLSTTPRIDHKGICKTDDTAVIESLFFDNNKGITFEYISICDNRYSRISKVYVNAGSNDYDTIVSDSEALKMGVVRQRYLSLLNSKSGTLSDVDDIIKNGRDNSFSVVLKSNERIINKLGCKAKVNVKQCEGREFIVKALKYTANSKGESTTVNLGLR